MKPKRVKVEASPGVIHTTANPVCPVCPTLIKQRDEAIARADRLQRALNEANDELYRLRPPTGESLNIETT